MWGSGGYEMVQHTNPKPIYPLPQWIEANVRLPFGVAAEPGPIKLQRAIADAIADPAVERVSVLKSARIGFTTIVVGAIAHLEAIEWPEGHPARVLPRFESEAGPCSIFVSGRLRVVPEDQKALGVRKPREIAAWDGS